MAACKDCFHYSKTRGFIELERGDRFTSDIIEAIHHIKWHPELTPIQAYEHVRSMQTGVKVKLWSHEALQAVEREAQRQGLLPEQYMALAVLEKLHREGLISDKAYGEATALVKTMDPRRGMYALYQLEKPPTE